MEKVDWKAIEIKPHNIVCAYTTEPDYEMQRYILLNMKYGEHIVLEGYHCSCYDFDDTEWEAILYKDEELKKLASADYNKNHLFWKEVLKHA